LAKKHLSDKDRFLDLVSQASRLAQARKQASKLKKGLKSPRERRLEKRVAIGPVLWDQMLLRAVVEGDMVVAERWDVPSLAWVRDGITIAEVASGIDATGDEMEALGYFSSSPSSGLIPSSDKNEQAQKSLPTSTKASPAVVHHEATAKTPGQHPSQRWGPEEQWQALLSVFAHVLENQAQRIGEEWSWFGGQQDPLYLLDRLGRAEPALAISKFRKVSPNLDLNKLKYLDSLQPEEMYDYAVGILSLMAPDP